MSEYYMSQIDLIFKVTLKKLVKAFSISALVFLTATHLASEAISTNAVGGQNSWTVFVESEPRECWLISEPIPGASLHQRDGKTVEVDRGENTQLSVSFLPDDNISGQVSFTGGRYLFDADADSYVIVDDKRYQLIILNDEGTNSDRGWAHPLIEEEEALVKDMRNGIEAKITTTSKRGTVSTDLFSLIGFTAAFKLAEDRCSK